MILIREVAGSKSFQRKLGLRTFFSASHHTNGGLVPRITPLSFFHISTILFIYNSTLCRLKYLLTSLNNPLVNVGLARA